MSAISKTDHALQAVLARALAPARPVDPGAVGGQLTKATPDTEAAPAAFAFDLDADLRLRVARIERDAPDRRARMIRALLESCVARTFGAAAPSDPGFRHVIDQARDAMQSNPELLDAMDRLAAQIDGADGAPPP